MCNNDSNASSIPTAASKPAAYTVDPSHPLYSATEATELLDAMPTAISGDLRSKARALSDVLLVHMFAVMTDPRTQCSLLFHPAAAVVHLPVQAAIEEEITRRYVNGVLALPFVEGGQATLDYLTSPEAQSEIAAFHIAAARGDAAAL